MTKQDLARMRKIRKLNAAASEIQESFGLTGESFDSEAKLRLFKKIRNILDRRF